MWILKPKPGNSLIHYIVLNYYLINDNFRLHMQCRMSDTEW
jgi:hypothetical protein